MHLRQTAAEDVDSTKATMFEQVSAANRFVKSQPQKQKDIRREINRMLAAPADRQPNIEDVWLYLHLMFELVWRYRFFYRDLNDLLSRNRKLELQFKQILAHKIMIAQKLCQGLRNDQALEARFQMRPR